MPSWWVVEPFQRGATKTEAASDFAGALAEVRAGAEITGDRQ